MTSEGSETRYTYRRALGARDLVAALGIAAGAGAVAFYLARLVLERTPLIDERDGEAARDARERPATTRRAPR